MKLEDVKGVGEKTLEKLNSLGIYSLMDLMDNLPKSYLDLTKIATFDDIVEGEYILLKVNIEHIYPRQYSNKNKTCYIKCDCVCDGHPMTLIWFNMPYIEHNLGYGDFLVWGIVRFENKKYTIINPNIADVENKYKLKDVKPVYSLKGKLGEVVYRKIVDNALKDFVPNNLLPNLFDLRKIYQNIHFAKTYEEMYESQSQLALYEMVVQLLCYKVLRNIKECEVLECVYPHSVDNLLGYKLTESQQKAINEIICDLKSGFPMNRFVLGDVGSGKTIVAHIAMYMIYQKGFQSVLLAPTEILAIQHFNNFNNVFKRLNIKVALLTSSTSKEDRQSILSGLKTGEISVLLATHSCIEDSVCFNNLKLAVIDEAHKFGVKQKANLIAKGDGVHCLSMSATPLPRSFAMMVFGDLKISKLYKSEDRKSNIKTFSLRSNKIEDMFKYFANKIKNNSQIIIVCPRVVDSGVEDFYSVKSVYKMLAGKYFNKEDIGILYGSMKNTDKEKTINDFYNGNIKVLVSTTVIEVGIDVANVDTIAILGADRFGIATLHQLRGRIGRDGRPAECYLHCASLTVPERINKMKVIDDGVVLSELDSKARGFGDLIGFNQSGKNTFDKYVVKITLDMIDKAKSILDNINISELDNVLLSKLINKYNFYQDIVLN